MERDEALLRLRAALIALIGGEPFAGAGVAWRPRSPSGPDAAAVKLPARTRTLMIGIPALRRALCCWT